jgi:hypothetical protein
MGGWVCTPPCAVVGGTGVRPGPPHGRAYTIVVLVVSVIVPALVGALGYVYLRA